MKVLILTFQQKTQIENELYDSNSLFNPVQDGNNPPNWVITKTEADNCICLEFPWVKDLPEIEWVPPIEPPINNEP